MIREDQDRHLQGSVGRGVSDTETGVWAPSTACIEVQDRMAGPCLLGWNPVVLHVNSAEFKRLFRGTMDEKSKS